MEMEEQTKDFADYLDAFRRRRSTIVTTGGVLFLIGLLVALLWPPTYKSTATILIKEQEVPPELVQSTVTSYATQRIQEISQRVMTRANLLKIIDQYNLYADDRERKTTEEIIEDMRDDIDLEMISADVIDPRTGRPVPATIAFSLSYEGEDPEQVQKVANELASLYMQENLKNRKSKAAETYKFLTEEANRVSKRIAELEKQLADFKEKHVNALPELVQLNNQLMERTERDIADVESQIRAAEERRFYLQGQLNQLEPYGTDVNLSPAARLKALRTEYASMLGKYAPDHPDVVRLRREIQGLERETGLGPDRQELLEELDKLRTELGSVLKKYTPEHPDVVRLKKAIANVKAEIAKLPPSASKSVTPKREADNPAYVTIQAQLEAAENDIRRLKVRKAELEQKLDDYQKRLTETPQVERKYEQLKREHDTDVAKYQELKSKQMEAQLAQQLETESKGEQFVLIDPPALPEEPIKPNRPAIVFLSFIFAIGGGLGFAAVGESLDSSIRGVKGVVNALELPPLAVIPYLATAEEDRRRKRRLRNLVLGGVAGIILALLLVHFLWIPLDVLWFRALRKVSLMAGL